MSETLFFAVSVFVFLMMFVGLALTVWEFKYGEPRRQAAQSKFDTLRVVEHQADRRDAA